VGCAALRGLRRSSWVAPLFVGLLSISLLSSHSASAQPSANQVSVQGVTPATVNVAALAQSEELLAQQGLLPGSGGLPIAVPSPPLPSLLLNATSPLNNDLSSVLSTSARRLKPHDSGTSPFGPSPSSAPSPLPASSFQALGYADILSSGNGAWIPPDTQGAVGPNNLMVALNGEIRIQDRLGNELSHVSLNGFWASIYQANINAGDYAYDPKLRYDPYNQRWMITVCTGANLANSRVLIGVSQTSDPTQNWNLYAIPSSNSGSVWADQGNIGFNKNWVSVSVNMYSLAVDEAHSQFQRAVLYVVDKVKIYTNNTLSYRAFSDSGSSLVTASTYDNTINPLYVVGKSNGGAASVTLYKIDGAVGAETFNSIANVSTSNGPWINGSTYAVPQLGDSRTIDTDDDRVSSCIYRGGSTNGSIWFTQTISPTSGPARDDIQWWQITPSGNVSQTGRIDDPSGNTFYGYSSIAVNKHNAALIRIYAFLLITISKRELLLSWWQ